MRRDKAIAIPTFAAAIFTGIAIWLIAGPPPHSPKPVNARAFVASTK
jgi:hypothetical protein